MIKQIGKYWSISGKGYKQIYSPHNRMIQISNNKVYYIDTHKMQTIKEFRRVLMGVNNENIKTDRFIRSK